MKAEVGSCQKARASLRAKTEMSEGRVSNQKDDEHSGHILSETRTRSKGTDLTGEACLRMEASLSSAWRMGIC